MRPIVTAAPILALLLSGSGWAEDLDVERACAGVASAGFPVTDRPSAAETVALKGCDAEALYYGMGVTADPVKARACAFVQLESGDEEMFGGLNILMMIYANGKGARRDLDAAMGVACKTSHAPAERELRVKHLWAMRAQPGDFDLCDDITSGYMQGMCTAHGERVHAVARARRRSAFIEKVPEAAKADFAALEGAATRFFEARAEHEVDQSGTGRAAFRIAEQSALEDGFLELLEQAARGEAPAATPRQYQEAEAALNATYHRVMKRKPTDTWVWGTVTSAGIRETQRAWLPYRDAWARFGRKLLTNSSSEGWKDRATRQRIEMLSSFDRD